MNDKEQKSDLIINVIRKVRDVIKEFAYLGLVLGIGYFLGWHQVGKDLPNYLQEIELPSIEQVEGIEQ